MKTIVNWEWKCVFHAHEWMPKKCQNGMVFFVTEEIEKGNVEKCFVFDVFVYVE